MGTVVVDVEFQGLIPPLTESEFMRLEKKILAEGCTERLKVWRHGGQDVLIDGHNRFAICQKHGIPFEVDPVELKDRGAVKRWMIENQLGRRNANSFVKVELAAKLLGWSPEKARQSQLSGLKRGDVPVVSNDTTGKQDITLEVAKVAGVSRATAARALYVLHYGADDIVAQCRAGDLSVSAAYQSIREKEQAENKAVMKKAAEEQAKLNAEKVRARNAGGVGHKEELLESALSFVAGGRAGQSFRIKPSEYYIGRFKLTDEERAADVSVGDYVECAGRFVRLGTMPQSDFKALESWAGLTENEREKDTQPLELLLKAAFLCFAIGESHFGEYRGLEELEAADGFADVVADYLKREDVRAAALGYRV